MHSNSVRAERPPEQDKRPLIREWWTEGYRIELRDTGDRGADIVGTTATYGRLTYGRIEFDVAQDRHLIEWNRDGAIQLEQYKRDHWDWKFYYAMAQWARRCEQAPS